MKSLLEILRLKFVHPLANRAPKPGRTPIEVERREYKQALTQAHIDAYRERRDAEAEREKGLAVKRRIEGFIESAMMIVDRRLYERGLV
jgi:hypothetical protein